MMHHLHHSRLSNEESDSELILDVKEFHTVVLKKHIGVIGSNKEVPTT